MKLLLSIAKGEHATLKDYRALAQWAFEPDSPAVRFLDEKIAEQGPDEKVLTDPEQMIRLLSSMNEKQS